MALQQPSCRVDDRLSLSLASLSAEIFPLIDFFTPSGSCDRVERLNGFVVERIGAGGGHSCTYATWERAESWTFPAWWKVGVPSRGTWHPHSPKLDGSNSPNHLLTVEIMNHASLFSKLNPCLLVAADFSCPSWLFTVKREFFHIQNWFLSPSFFFFFFNKTWVFATSTYLNNRESTETIKVWFNRCFNSPFTVPFRRNREAVSAHLSQFLTCRVKLWIEFDEIFLHCTIFWNVCQDKLI